MKKNLGNGIVKKSIIVAMSFMLITASPVVNVVAAEDTQTTQSTTNNDSFEFTEEEVEFAEELATEIANTAEKYNTSGYSEKDVIDEACTIVEEKVNNTISEKLSEVNEVTDEAESVAGELSKDAEKLSSNINNYKDATDELLNADQEIVASVEGNTNNIVDTITKDGDVLLNVKNEDGEQVKVQDYTQEKADAATSAAAEAQEILNNITASSNVAEERAKINEAVAKAEAAKDEAETAYNAAKSVLIDEIKRYNAYAAKYGYDLYEYEGTTPAYTEEELANLSDLSMTKTDIENGLDNLNNATWEVQTEKIENAEHMLKACEIAVDMADSAIKQFEDAEDRLVANLENMMAQTENAMNNATGAQKDVYQGMYESVKALYDVYTKGDDTTKESYQAIFNYADEKANTLADTVDQAVENAKNDLYGENGAVTRYNAALAEYQKIKAEYDNYAADKNTVDTNFEDLKKKLANAEAAVNAAQEDVRIAIDAVNTATDIKKQFEETVKPSSGSESGSGSDSDNSGSSSSSSSSSTTATTDSAAVLTLEDVITPLTATIADEATPLTATIVDEATPLADAVPKTGDASAAAGAVGASGLAAMAGALFLNLKKRTLR